VKGITEKEIEALFEEAKHTICRIQDIIGKDKETETRKICGALATFQSMLQTLVFSFLCDMKACQKDWDIIAEFNAVVLDFTIVALKEKGWKGLEKIGTEERIIH